MTELLKSASGMSDEDKKNLAEAMLGSKFADIELLPDFVTLPKGAFLVEEVVKAEVQRDEETGMPSIALIFKTGATIELAQFPNTPVSSIDPALLPPEGSLVSYRFTGPLGIQQFRKAFSPVVEATGEDPGIVPFLELLSMGQIQGLAFINGHRYDKEKKVPNPVTGVLEPLTYNNLVQVQMA